MTRPKAPARRTAANQTPPKTKRKKDAGLRDGQPAVCPTGQPCAHCDGIVTVRRTPRP